MSRGRLGIVKGAYVYSGLEAELYDRLDELSGFDDLDFYQRFAEAGGGVALELGCGTGRVMRPLLRAGLEVVGLDISAEMLALCRTALERESLQARLEQGDMRDFDVGAGRFATVMIAGYSAQLLLDDEDLLRCLRCCRWHLAPGGRLILPIYLPWEMIWDEVDERPLEERRVVRDEGGERLVAKQGWRIDRERQRLQLENRYERWDANGELLEAEDNSMTLRWDLPHQMLELLGEAGFEEVEMYGDFEFEPPEADSESVVYVGRVG